MALGNLLDTCLVMTSSLSVRRTVSNASLARCQVLELLQIHIEESRSDHAYCAGITALKRTGLARAHTLSTRESNFIQNGTLGPKYLWY